MLEPYNHSSRCSKTKHAFQTQKQPKNGVLQEIWWPSEIERLPFICRNITQTRESSQKFLPQTIEIQFVRKKNNENLHLLSNTTTTHKLQSIKQTNEPLQQIINEHRNHRSSIWTLFMWLIIFRKCTKSWKRGKNLLKIFPKTSLST